MAVRIESTVDVADTSQVQDAISRVAHGTEHVVVEEHGEPVAVVISIEEYRRLREEASKAARGELHELSVQISRAFENIPDDELEYELGKARTDYRAERQAERDVTATG